MAKVSRIEEIPKEIPCCAYARVSTFKDEQESSLLFQQSYWKEKLQAMPNRKFCGVFADQGISGYKVTQRKEYCKMLELAKAGFIKEIYTKSIYRFGRNTFETINTIQELRQKGVAIIFDEEGINTLTCNQDIILKLKAILSEQELKTMSKNVQFTARKNFMNGIVPKAIIFGYDFDKDNKMIINEEEAKVVRLIFSLYSKGYGVTAIANQLGQLKIPTCHGSDIWSVATIENMLRNERYIGDALLQKKYKENGVEVLNKGKLDQYYVTNNHEPIIDRELFDFVQQRIQEQSKKHCHSKIKTIYPLTSKIECGKCGKNFKHKVNNKIISFDNNIWSCATKDRFGKNTCQATDIIESLLKEIILDAYNEFIEMPYQLKDYSEYNTRIKEIQELVQRLKRLYLDHLINYEQYSSEIEKLDKEQKDNLAKVRDYNLMSLYKKPRVKVKEYQDNLIEHIEKIIITGYKIEVIFKNNQSVTKEFKYEHRKYTKNY